jgi:hypothetical protein
LNAIGPKILYHAALHPTGLLLVLKPGHMFVGYYLDEAHMQFEFLETTMLGAGPQPGAYSISFSPLLHPVSRERIMAAARPHQNPVWRGAPDLAH